MQVHQHNVLHCAVLCSCHIRYTVGCCGCSDESTQDDHKRWVITCPLILCLLVV